MTEAKSRLKNVVLDEISFVGAGDNPEAHITLLKIKPNAESEEAITTKTKGEKVMSDKLKKELEDGQVELKKAQDSIDALTVERDDFAKEVETLKAEVETLKADSKEETTSIDKSTLPAEVVKQLDDQEASIKKQAADLAILKEENEMRVIVTKAAELSHVGAVDDVTKVLKNLTTLNKEQSDSVFDLLKAADARIKESTLLKEEGSSSSDNGSDAVEKIKALAKKLQETSPDLTDEQAFVKIYQSNNDLRKAYNEEVAK